MAYYNMFADKHNMLSILAKTLRLQIAYETIIWLTIFNRDTPPVASSVQNHKIFYN